MKFREKPEIVDWVAAAKRVPATPAADPKSGGTWLDHAAELLDRAVDRAPRRYDLP